MPLIIIAFDETQVLTNSADNRVPPILSTLRNCLSNLKGSGLFILFLSTTGDIAPFLSPRFLPDVSGRLLTVELRLNPAFTGCMFDAFKPKGVVFSEGKMTIQQAASEWTMMHLGRPL